MGYGQSHCSPKVGKSLKHCCKNGLRPVSLCHGNWANPRNIIPKVGHDQSQGFFLVALGFVLVVLGFVLVVLGFYLVVLGFVLMGLGFYLGWVGFVLVSGWVFV